MKSTLLPTAIEFLNAGHCIQQQNRRHPTRSMNCHELIIVHNGQLDMFESSTEFRLAAHQFLYLQSGLTHGGLSDYADDLSFYWFHFQLQGLKTLPFKYGHFKRPEIAINLASRLLDEQEREDAPRGSCNGLFYLLCLECTATQDQQHEDPNALVDRAQLFIRQQFTEAISSRDVAEHCSCHPDHLGRLFQARLHTSIGASIRNHRLRRARSLLRDSNNSIATIATLSGFSEAHYFRRCFKADTGLTPSAWRSMHQREFIN